MDAKDKLMNLKEKNSVLWLRGDLANYAAVAFMSVPWAGETAFLIGIFLLGLSLGCLYHVSKMSDVKECR